jgi:ATP-binding cassette subfamily B protein
MLCAPLAFNLLLGRAWPPVEADGKLGHAICIDLGLGPLIERMPSGYGTMVGEIGWQLSHGEKSRVFLARALLQGADIVMLDETLAALDPESLTTCVNAALKRSKTLLVITHARTESEQRGADGDGAP